MKKCSKCSLNERYQSSALCYSCLRDKQIKTNSERTICAKCFETKEPGYTPYCGNCRKFIYSSNKYRDMDADFKINLWLLMNELDENDIGAVDAFVIAHWWSCIILLPHTYWNKSAEEQLKFMIIDIKEFLAGKRIRKNKKKK